jgi:uncharacterized surface protein with fasciclin (FAS1) repeats
MMKRGYILGLFFLAVASCTKKETAPAPIPITPLQVLVNSDSTLSYYHRLIILANETGLLADDTVTLLIPTNSAFRAAGYTQSFIDSLQTSAAGNLVRYLFIPFRTNVPNTDSTAYTPYATLSGYSIYGMPNSQGILFNGAQAVRDTARSGKAQVYRLNATLSAPVDSLPDYLASDTSLTFLAEAFRRTNLYDSLLLSGNYTLLAPVNSAFMNAGYDSLPAIDSADLGSLIRLLEYHVATGVRFANTLAAASPLMTIEGGTIDVTIVSGGIQFTGNNNTVPALLLQGDQMVGSRIVVQRISQLLLP